MLLHWIHVWFRSIHFICSFGGIHANTFNRFIPFVVIRICSIAYPFGNLAINHFLWKWQLNRIFNVIIVLHFVLCLMNGKSHKWKTLNIEYGIWIGRLFLLHLVCPLPIAPEYHMKCEGNWIFSHAHRIVTIENHFVDVDWEMRFMHWILNLVLLKTATFRNFRQMFFSFHSKI